MTNKNTYNLLSQINIPADLRRLPIDKLPQVCEELRRDIIDELADNPGHFASSLGVVELTVALHYVYDTPYDRIVWDVGHQAYGHKILTGRRERFSTNRKLHGLKPFLPKANTTRSPADMLPIPSPPLWAWRWPRPIRMKKEGTSLPSSATVR